MEITGASGKIAISRDSILTFIAPNFHAQKKRTWMVLWEKTCDKNVLVHMHCFLFNNASLKNKNGFPDKRNNNFY